MIAFIGVCVSETLRLHRLDHQPGCGQVMSDPVMASDGYTYERAAIQEWFRQGGSHCSIACPGTKSAPVVLCLPTTKRKDEHLAHTCASFVGCLPVGPEPGRHSMTMMTCDVDWSHEGFCGSRTICDYLWKAVLEFRHQETCKGEFFWKVV
eukprot:6056351-Amphidinium_carterae.1